MRSVSVKSINNDSTLSAVLDMFGKLNLGYGPWIAGGCARKLWYGEPWDESDIDFFFPNINSFNTANGVLIKIGKLTPSDISIEKDFSALTITSNPTFPSTGLNSPYVTQNALTYSLGVVSSYGKKEIKVQIINRQFYDSIESIWNDFDFTVCNFATDGRTVIADINALKDVELKVLRCNNLLKRKIDVKRTMKYAAYGFNPETKIINELFKQKNNGTLMDGWDDEYP